MTYIISYFVVNIIFASKMVHNVYFVAHPPDEEKEMKEDMQFFFPLTLLFGTILLVMEYYYRTLDGE
jgi:hypothetical protein